MIPTMSLGSRIRDLLFGSEAADAHGANSEDLLALPGAAMTLEQRVGYVPTGEAALCFAPADAGGFEETIADLRSVLDATEAEAGTDASWREDDHGYRWLVLADDEQEDVATALHFAAEAFAERDFGDQLLAALVAYADADRRAYLVYTFERGRFYPFAPEGTDARDAATEFRLQSVLAPELPFEDDRSEWFPLWPDEPGGHPWG